MADNIRIVPGSTGSVYARTKEITAGVHTSAVLLSDDAGNFYTPNAITQNVVLSSNNNRSSTLGAGLSWTGNGEGTLNCAGIQVNFEGDQHSRITVYQSQDNVTYLIADAFDYQKNGSFGITVQATASYFKVKVENLSSGTLTYKLQSVLCPTVEALPRALSDKGNLKVGLYELEDELGNHGYISPVGDLRVAEPYRLVGTTFGSAADATFWTLTSNGTGASAAITNDVATLVSGSSNSGYGQIASVRSARFISLHPILCRINARVTAAAVTACTRRFGAFTVTGQTPVAGYYFEIAADGTLSVVTSGGGSVASGSFNGAVPEYVVDTNIHTYDIIYRNTKVQFIIDGTLIHTASATTARLSAVAHLPACATCINGSSAASGTLEIWSMSMTRLGRNTTAPTSKFQSGTTAGVVCKLGPGKIHGLVISNVTNGAVVTLYDNTTATGTVLWSSGTIPVTANQNPGIVPIPFSDGLTFFTGLSFAITTANCNLLVLFE